MAILVAGGIYKDNTGDLVGGHFISALIAQHTYEDVYLHTNFSSEDTGITSELKKTLRASGVNHSSSHTVSSPYGYISEDGFIGNSNVFETFKTKAKYLQEIDKLVMTTDIGERDFKYILNYASAHDIETIIISCGEYVPRNISTQVDTILLDDSGQPNYHNYISMIKNALVARDVIDNKTAENRKIPSNQISKSGKFLLQIVMLAAVLLLIFIGGFKLLDYINTDGETFEADIDWRQPVEHEECGTVETCKELGDNYLNELREYVDLQDEPHIFFENRSRTTYINYEIEDYEIIGSETENTLPFGTEAAFTYMWEVFSYVFPNEYISDINEYRLFSDGEGNTGAYVSITREGTVLAMDIRDNIHKAPQYRNLIHEFGHIYSLRIEDFDEGCETTDITCVIEGTTIDNYANRFWHQYSEEWLENSDKSQYQLEAFYNNNVTDFYVPYQATNVKEDYAITFMKFITEKIPVNSSQLRDVKVQSMYEHSELVALRVEILKSFVEFEKERAA